MSYESSEESVFDAKPVHCFLFSHRGTIWRWARSDEVITIPALGDFRPGVLEETEITQTAEDDSGALQITVHRTNPVAALFVGLPPTEPVRLSVYRVHRDSLADFRGIWTGEVGSAEFLNDRCVLHGGNVLAELDVEIPGVVYHPTCNRQLFSSPCGVPEASFTVTGFVTAIAGADIFADEFAAHPDDWFKGGRAMPPDRPIRFILEHEGTRIRVTSPIPGLQVGDQILITSGCDGLDSTCLAKYANLPNHFGFDVPTRDAYIGRIA